MGTPTTNLGIVKPAGTDAFNRTAFNVILDQIDAAAIPNTTKGTAGGVATLDSGTLIPLAQIPSLDLAHIPAMDLAHVPTNIPSTKLAAAAATDAIIGNRTIDDTVVAVTGADTPTNLWSKIGNMIKGITGKANWFTAPAITLETVNTKFGVTGHTHDGTAGNGPQILAGGLANGAATDTVLGNRTINDVTTPAAGANTLTNLLSMIGNLIKNITGQANWYTAPTTSLAALLTALGTKLNLSGGTMSGNVAYARNELQQPKIKDYSEVVSTNAAATGAVTLDLSLGNVFDNTLTGATTYTFANPAPAGQACSFTLLLRQGGASQAVTWPASVKWANDVIPDVSAISKTSVLTFVTINGGTRWYGFLGANKLVT